MASISIPFSLTKDSTLPLRVWSSLNLQIQERCYIRQSTEILLLIVEGGETEVSKNATHGTYLGKLWANQRDWKGYNLNLHKYVLVTWLTLQSLHAFWLLQPRYSSPGMCYCDLLASLAQEHGGHAVSVAPWPKQPHGLPFQSSFGWRMQSGHKKHNWANINVDLWRK